MSKVVIAIGGNALGQNPQEQKKIVKNTANHLVNFVKNGNNIVLVHGNGPQVGMINNTFETANKSNPNLNTMDFPECGAMSEGYIGYHLQQTIQNEFANKKLAKNVVTLITQTLVNKNDVAFNNPTKPIGSFMSEAEAEKISKINNWNVKEDAGRGWRRVIASPKPLDILEINSIKLLFNNDNVVICGGGGGIPVINEKGIHQGIDAVIDKDLVAAKIAELLKTDTLIILTSVDFVFINYNKQNQKKLIEITIDEAEKYIKEQQFAAGSMLPKIQAAIEFVKLSKKPAYIGALDKLEEIIKGKSGTKIILK